MASQLTHVEDAVFVLSVQQHIHQVLCTGTSEHQLSLCRCKEVATELTETLRCIPPERNREGFQNRSARDASTWTLLNIRQLEQQSSAGSDNCHGCLRSPHHNCTNQCELGQDSIPLHSNLLIGYLTNVCKEGDKTERLFLKDHTGLVPCQILNCDMSWLRQLVVLHCWNYISDKRDSNSIEVCHQCKPHLVPLNDVIATDITGWPAWMSQIVPQDDTMNVEDAQQLMADRSQEGAKKMPTHVTLSGFVTAKSPLYRVRSTPFFFVELSGDSSDSKVTILSKEMENAYLYHFLHIGKMYTITNVLLTTINKGTKSPHPVLVCQSKTCVKEVETNNMTVTPTILGSILKCVNAEAGIYELEGRVRLYLCYMHDGSKQYQRYRIGTKIAVYNAHDYMLGKPPKRCIVCCLRSTVVITEHSQQAPDIDNKVKVNSGKSLLYLILKLNPSPSRMHWLCSICPILQQKLGPFIYSKKAEHSAIWKLLTTPSATNSLEWITATKRNVYEEFLNHRTQPCVANKSSLDKVLVGYLETNLPTGQLLLVDKTGSIPCLVTDMQSQMKHSELYQDGTEKTKGSHAPIPPSMLDQVIRVDKFLIVMEEFVHHEGDGSSGTTDISKIADNLCLDSKQKNTQVVEQDWSRVYAVFDLTDAVILCPAISLNASKKPVKRTAASAGLKQPNIGMDKLTLQKPKKCAIFSVKTKSWPQQESAESANLSFFVDADYIDICEDDKDGEILHRDSSDVVKTTPAALWFNKDAMKWFPALVPSCVYRLSLDSSCPPNESVLVSAVQSSKTSLSKVIKKAGSTQVLCVSQFAKLTMLQENEIPPEIVGEYNQIQANVKSACSLNSITHILQTESGPYDNVVSFRGMIVSCQYATAKATRSHQTQPEWQMKVLVKDPAADTGDDDVTVRVYINVSSSTYPAGLVPGSIVAFRCVVFTELEKDNRDSQSLYHLDLYQEAL
ncbi:CST complex subunit CTC1-like [Amphiura filiformis]|uniref:CST complex subunit CTC1-like n=1 Tax=Amphiura filiformis TaxID=82378 RepID=UPI003B212046